MKAVVTIRLPRNPRHDPRHKVTGKCPLSDILGYHIQCTDVTGEHHSIPFEGMNESDIRLNLNRYNLHITRIEFYQ